MTVSEVFGGRGFPRSWLIIVSGFALFSVLPPFAFAGVETASAAAPVREESRYELPGLTHPTSQVFFRQAIGHLDDGKKLLAFQSMQKAVQMQPDHPELLSRAALLGMELGDSCLGDIRPFLDSLSRLRGDSMREDEQIAFARVLFLVEPFDFGKASAVIDQVLKKNPRSLPGIVTAGDLELARGKFREALEMFQRGKALDARCPGSLWGIGYALKGMGQSEPAVRAFLDAYSTSPDLAVSNEKMGRAMVDLGRPMTASKYFQQALDIDKDCLGAHVGLLGILLSRNQDMSARKHLKAALVLDPRNPRLHLYQGIFNEMRGNLEGAIRSYEISAAAGPNVIDARLRLARIFSGVGHSFPGNTFSNTHPGDLWRYKECFNPRKAISLFKEVLALDPDHSESASITFAIDQLEEGLGSNQ